MGGGAVTGLGAGTLTMAGLRAGMVAATGLDVTAGVVTEAGMAGAGCTAGTGFGVGGISTGFGVGAVIEAGAGTAGEVFTGVSNLSARVGVSLTGTAAGASVA